jgi:predicted component of viral defense system (DUF524 family)
VRDEEAREYGESTIQLRESERYEYTVEPLIPGRDLRLRSSVSSPRRNIKRGKESDSGLIETKSFCGTLILELVDGEDVNLAASATALIDVRSVKVDYRTEYRGMLRRLSDEIAGLAIDCRLSNKLSLLSSYEQRDDEGWFQIQLEILRELLDSSSFAVAIQRILNFPQERSVLSREIVNSDRYVRWDTSGARQLISGNPRKSIPNKHDLFVKSGLGSISERVCVNRKAQDLDSPENRFIKHVLVEFRAFLAHAQIVFERSKGWTVSAVLCQRLSLYIEGWLGRSFFQGIGAMRLAPLGSPVLQRKSGYREILQWWLRFRTTADLSWKGGEEIFHAGQRNAATLYEYWLFFELLGWYCNACRNGRRPPIDVLVDGLNEGSPNLRLKQRTELGPFEGAFSKSGRRMKSRFSYNRRFRASKNYEAAGSWTRALHPDYTLSFWPAELDEEEAEKHELMTHIHFDAKYRVESIEDIFGIADSEDADEMDMGNYKRQDLLKMHAYRDAIKRSQGAYVLYPGNNRSHNFNGFHEIIPGLGAFSISPDEDGKAKGMDALTIFLDEILEHLGNRTTARERVSYHTSEAYMVKEPPVKYGNMDLPEFDSGEYEGRALPPAEKMVLIAWCNTEAQRVLANSTEGIVFVRLGNRRGAFHIHPNLSAVRHIALRGAGGEVYSGLLSLREPGFRVYTRADLRSVFSEKNAFGISPWESDLRDDDTEYIYAVFKTRPESRFTDLKWNGDAVMNIIERFESKRRNKLIENVGRLSPYPRVIPLQELFKSLTLT